MCSTILALVVVLLCAELVGSNIRTIGIIAISRCIVSYTFLLVLTAVETTVLNQAIEPELGSTPHYGDCLLQEFLVMGITPMVPQMTGIPCIGYQIVVAPCAHAIVERSLCKHTPAITIIIPISHSLPAIRLCSTNNEV